MGQKAHRIQPAILGDAIAAAVGESCAVAVVIARHVCRRLPNCTAREDADDGVVCLVEQTAARGSRGDKSQAELYL